MEEMKNSLGKYVRKKKLEVNVDKRKMMVLTEKKRTRRVKYQTRNNKATLRV